VVFISTNNGFAPFGIIISEVAVGKPADQNNGLLARVSCGNGPPSHVLGWDNDELVHSPEKTINKILKRKHFTRLNRIFFLIK